MGGSPKKNQERPSYEEGKLRDPSIEKMQDTAFQPEHLRQVIKKAAQKKPPKGLSP